jgi:hypothetical protein
LDYEIPNGQLVKEGSDLAEKYGNQSIAEQNSVDLAWKLLMNPDYEDLRRCLFNVQEEIYGFRHLLVKCVMATDICDKESAACRARRWEQVFSQSKILNDDHHNVTVEEVASQKAWLIVEHLIQVSDVSHTLQHFNVFLKWNKLLFKETFLLYKTGRSGNDPSHEWYENELKFFDKHIIPLAKRVRDCKVFGVAAHVSLNNAIANRREWLHKKDVVVKDYVADFRKKSVVQNVISTSVRRIPSHEVSDGRRGAEEELSHCDCE